MKPALVAMSLLLALAAAALAQTGSALPYAGQWVYGDNMSDLRVELRENEAVMNLTTAVDTLFLRNVTTHALYRIAGVMVEPLAGKTTFEDIGTSVGNPGARVTDFYECRIKIVRSGETGWTPKFRLSVTKSAI